MMSLRGASPEQAAVLAAVARFNGEHMDFCVGEKRLKGTQNKRRKSIYKMRAGLSVIEKIVEVRYDQPGDHSPVFFAEHLTFPSTTEFVQTELDDPCPF